MKSARKGRPSRAQASAKMLKVMLDCGIDPSTIDARAILGSIAADPSGQPAHALRRARCSWLMPGRAPARMCQMTGFLSGPLSFWAAWEA
jgi:hypothetical protein